MNRKLINEAEKAVLSKTDRAAFLLCARRAHVLKGLRRILTVKYFRIKMGMAGSMGNRKSAGHLALGCKTYDEFTEKMKDGSETFL